MGSLRTGPGSGAKVTRQKISNLELARYAKGKMSELGKQIEPDGVKFVGYEVVFLYEKESLAMGTHSVAFVSYADFDNGVPEPMASAALKELGKTCMEHFGRTPPKERT